MSVPFDRRLAIGLAFGLVTTLMWAGWSVVSRRAALGGLSAFDVTALRFIVAGVISLPFLLRRRIGRHGIGTLPWRAIGLMFIGAGVPYCLISLGGFAFAPAGHGALQVPATVMILTTAYAAFFLGERPRPRGLVGLAAVMAGVFAVGLSGLTGAVGPDAWQGHVLFFFAAVCWATFTLAARIYRADALTATAAVAVVSALVYLPPYFAVTGSRLWHQPLNELLLQGLYQGLVAGVLAIITFTKTIEALGAARASLFPTLVPVLANLLAVPVLGEPLTPATMAGMVLVTGGMVLAMSSGLRPRPTPGVTPGRAGAT
ncbi:MAG: DMT family transporter [Alphaproteobacteria bacterium]|jgi:drug/metabolite transporter (DMT)-like permease|nr:DMT family transporter [Alphaproteobacteria bacterium]